MKYIKIISKGVIDPKAFTLIGASSKREDKAKIGYFGSGLKYSLAYLLRNKIEFRVFSDFKEHIINTQPTNFRDKGFDVICVDGEPSSLTTEMGIDWKAWFIIREIYCNALDEGESRISTITEEPVPTQDYTVFYIDQTPFLEVVEDWGTYFSEGRPENDLIHTDEKGNKYFKGGAHRIVYRKGIQCEYVKDTDSLFNYDLQWIVINESRTIKSEWDFTYRLVQELKKSESTTIVSQILCQIRNVWEKDLSWSYGSFSNVWLELISDKTLVHEENAGFWSEELKINPMAYLILPASMVDALKDQFADKIKVIGEGSGKRDKASKVIEASPKQKFLLNAAIEFLKKSGYEIEFPVETVKFKDDMVLGFADLKERKILISEKTFDKGQKQLVTCLMEENEHIKSGFGDKTREFQNHIFEQWVGTLENLNNTWL